jgi:hypothetical protein
MPGGAKMKAQNNPLTQNKQSITLKSERSNKMKRNLLLLAMMSIALLFFSRQSQTQDLGVPDTLYVETFDCDHTYEADPGSFDSVRAAIYVTHDSNTFWYDVGQKWVQDSIRVFAVPLYFWHQPSGCADSVILPNWDNWNNTIINQYDPKMSRSMFRHLVDEHTGDTTYNRLLQMVENGKVAWSVITDIESHSCDGDSGHVFLALIPMQPACQAWWEGRRELLATLTFNVYMSDTCDTTEIGLDSTFWPPAARLSFTRYDAVTYIPRHFLPVKDTIYIVTPTLPPALTYIPNVPDWNQPPLSGSTNYCAPVAALNIIDYYDPSPAGGLVDPADAPRYPDSSNTADLIGWFMGTNGAGSTIRFNNASNPLPGTYFFDQDTGLAEYIAWSAASPFPTPGLPPVWKTGYTNAKIGLYGGTDSTLWQRYTAEIDSGRPVKVDFSFWDLVLSDSFVDNLTQDSFYVYLWGDTTYNSGPDDPEEVWSDNIGHAVTGVGYIPNWNGKNWAVVHDNWPNTPENVVIPWENLMVLVTVYPPKPSGSIDNVVNLTPHFDWGAISSYSGLFPPGIMGIFSPPHNSGFYFPSDSLSLFTSYPKAWLTPGVHLATRYGPANVRISSCPMPNSIVTVPDRNFNPCSLFVQIPPANLIDQAIDLNVIQISAGESKTIPINDTAETMVFLASCDGWAEDTTGPSPSQYLAVYLNYNDGTVDTAYFDNIHPAGRLDIIDPNFPPSWIFIFGNEVFVCNPAYFDWPTYFDPSHSEAWHWYPLYPDNTKLLQGITFVGIGYPDVEVYISALSYSSPPSPSFTHGDANGDGEVNLADAVYIVNYLFIGGPPPDLLEAGDANGDGDVDLADAVYIINYLFIGGPPPGGGKATSSGKNESELYKGKAPAQVGFSSPTISKDGIVNVPVMGKFDVDLAGVQLEIKYDPEKIVLLEPGLTSRTEDLTIYSSANEGIQRVGILDLSGEHHISAGTGALVNLRVKGSDLSSRFASLTTSLEITKAILVDRDAQKIPVNIVTEMKKSEEGLAVSKSTVPQEFSLSQNYPNPFNPETKISYALPTDCHVKLSIYNITGRKVKTLVDEHQTAGYKTVCWNGKDDQGKETASGIYFYKIRAGDFSQSRKMVLVK